MYVQISHSWDFARSWGGFGGTAPLFKLRAVLGPLLIERQNILHLFPRHTVGVEKARGSGLVPYSLVAEHKVDTWVALIILRLREEHPGLKLHCILPCTTQAAKWSALAQERYCSILEQADSIVYVSRAEHRGCMLERNRFLVSHADLLLAVGSPAGRSGTAATMRYAQKLGRRTIAIDPVTLQAAYSQVAQKRARPKRLVRSASTKR